LFYQDLLIIQKWEDIAIVAQDVKASFSMGICSVTFRHMEEKQNKKKHVYHYFSYHDKKTIKDTIICFYK